MTRITIVTPSYNQGAFLEETIRSVVSQRSWVHEYFVVDGGSTDGSVDIIRRYADQIDWWVSEKDDGQTDAITKGMRRATGDVVVWLNSDDVFLPGALQRVQQAFDANPALDILTGYMVFIDERSRITRCWRVPAPNALMRRWGPVMVTQPATFMKRQLYEQVGGLDTTLHCAMDYDLWARLYEARPAWQTLPRTIIGFRRHHETKGGSQKWAGVYASENARIRVRHPQLNRLARRQLGTWWYRLLQIATGRQLRAACETARYRGRALTDVYGDWPLARPS